MRALIILALTLPSLSAASTVPTDGLVIQESHSSNERAADGPFDLQRVLDQTVAKNRGRGGGVSRVGAPGQAPFFEGASGLALRSSGTPMETDFTFDIASTAKAFTGATALALYEAGYFDLDDAIGDYLAPHLTHGLLVIDGEDLGPTITVRQALNHTSGLPDYWYDPPYVRPKLEWNQFLVDFYGSPGRFFTPDTLLEYSRNLYPIGRPGEKYHYGDTGYVLVGLLLETVTGLPLQQVYGDYLYEPLGLTETYMPFREEPPSERVESQRFEWRYNMDGKRHQTADWAGGGLVSSTRDLERFVAGLFEGALFSNPATLDEMRGWIPTGVPDVWYGLGLFRVKVDGMGEVWGHDGYGNAWMYWWPQEKLAFTGTLNQALNDWTRMIYRQMSAVRWGNANSTMTGRRRNLHCLE